MLRSGPLCGVREGPANLVVIVGPVRVYVNLDPCGIVAICQSIQCRMTKHTRNYMPKHDISRQTDAIFRFRAPEGLPIHAIRAVAVRAAIKWHEMARPAASTSLESVHIRSFEGESDDDGPGRTAPATDNMIWTTMERIGTARGGISQKNYPRIRGQIRGRNPPDGWSPRDREDGFRSGNQFSYLATTLAERGGQLFGGGRKKSPRGLLHHACRSLYARVRNCDFNGIRRSQQLQPGIPSVDRCVADGIPKATERK